MRKEISLFEIREERGIDFNFLFLSPQADNLAMRGVSFISIGS
jgi:hypothetical protein